MMITCTSHPDYPIRSALLCKDSTVRIVACETGDVLTSLVCDLNFKATSCAYAVGESKHVQEFLQQLNPFDCRCTLR